MVVVAADSVAPVPDEPVPKRAARKRRGASGRGPVTYVLVAALLWGGPVAVALLVRPTRLEHRALFPVDDQVRMAVVGERSDDGAQPAALNLVWEPPLEIMWPARISGVITDVGIQPGSLVEDGLPLASVDGIARLAQLTGQPMYREIASGSSGPDVDWLDALLVGKGAAPSSTLDAKQRATSATTRAVKNLQTQIGAESDGIFRPEYTVWVGSTSSGGAASKPVGQVAASVGGTAEPGSEIFRTTPHLQQATLELSAPVSRQVLVHQVPLSLSVGANTVDLSGLVPTAEDLARLESLFDPATTTVDAVTVRRRVPFHAGVLPSSAIVPLPTGQGCVIVAPSADQYKRRRFDLVPVDSLEPGVSYVPADLIGLTVATNVTQSLAESCASG